MHECGIMRDIVGVMCGLVMPDVGRDAMKKIVARESLLAYPDFSKPFEFPMDTCSV